MLSLRLIHLIEDHWESIASQVVYKIRHDPELSHIGNLPESELRDWGQGILKNLGSWLLQREEEVARHYEAAGKRRQHEGVPLHETVHALQILKNTMVDYIRDRGLGPTAVELYAEEELEHRVGRFFDSVLYHVIRGYDEALKHVAVAGR